MQVEIFVEMFAPMGGDCPKNGEEWHTNGKGRFVKMGEEWHTADLGKISQFI